MSSPDNILCSFPPTNKTSTCLSSLRRNENLRQRVQKVVWNDSTDDERILHETYWSSSCEVCHPVNDSVNHVDSTYYRMRRNASAYSFGDKFVTNHLKTKVNGLDAQALKVAITHRLPSVKSIKLTTLTLHPRTIESTLSSPSTG